MHEHHYTDIFSLTGHDRQNTPSLSHSQPDAMQLSCLGSSRGRASLQVGMKPDAQSGPMDIRESRRPAGRVDSGCSAVLDTLQVTWGMLPRVQRASEAGFLLFQPHVIPPIDDRSLDHRGTNRERARQAQATPNSSPRPQHTQRDAYTWLVCSRETCERWSPYAGFQVS